MNLGLQHLFFDYLQTIIIYIWIYLDDVGPTKKEMYKSQHYDEHGLDKKKLTIKCFVLCALAWHSK